MGIKFIVPKPEAPAEVDKETVNKLVDSVDNPTPKLDKVTTKQRKPRGQQERVVSVAPNDLEVPLPEGFTPSKKDVPQETPTSKTTKSKKSSTKDKSSGELMSATDLAKQVKGIHAFLDVIFPGFAIEDYEAEQMGVALKGVMDAYDIKPSKKVSALIALGATVAIVEIPKIKLITLQVKQKQQANIAKQRATQNNKQKVDTGEPLIQEPAPALTLVTTKIAEGEPFRG